VQPGEAFLAEYSPTGELRRLDTFGHGRNNEIHQIRVNELGTVFSSGSLNSPLTHDSLKNQFNQSVILQLGLK